MAAIRDGAAAVACRGDPTSTTGHNSRHDIPGSTEERSSSRRSGTSHSSSWTATTTATPSTSSAGWAKSLTKAREYPRLLCEGPKEERQEKQRCGCGAYDGIALQKTNQGQTPPQFNQQLSSTQVKGIYAGLVMVENKCIVSLDELRFALNSYSSNTQKLIALHRTLLHEHHNFFLASRHPAANPALRHLASKYVMPARMWRHGIHSFLELLRHSLPGLMEHMLAFIYVAYTMMALLYETVPASEGTWIECLGDLGRYRMAIENDEIWNQKKMDQCLSILVL